MKNTALDDLATSLEELKALKDEVEVLRPEVEKLRKQLDRSQRRVKDLRAKNDALEKRANILSDGDETALFDMNATIHMGRKLTSKRFVTIRSGGKTVARKFDGRDNSKAGLLKDAVTEARKHGLRRV